MTSPPHPDFGTCPACGGRTLPVLELSPCGHDVAPRLAPLDEPGRVYSWTRSWSSPEDSTIIVMADFFDGDLRVTGPLDGDVGIAIGDTVWAHVGTASPFVLSTER